MSNAIDASIAAAAQEALAQYNAGSYAAGHERYKAIFAGISARYTAQEISSNASIACIMADFARVCAAQALASEAASLYESAVTVLKAVAGEQHPVTLRTISEWIRMKLDSGTLNDTNKQTLWDVYQLQAASPDDLAFTQLTLALLAASQGAYADALGVLASARAHCEAAAGPATKLHLLADVEIASAHCLVDLGKYADAEPLLSRALKLMENSPFLAQDFSVAAPDHPVTARAYQALGELCLRAGRAKDAVGHFSSAMRVRTRFLGEAHPETVLSASWAAAAHASAASIAMAKTLIQAAAAPSVAGADSQTPLAAQVLLNRTLVSETCAEYADATATAIAAQAIAQAAAPKSLLAAEAGLHRAHVDALLARFADAREGLQAVLAALQPLPPTPLLGFAHVENARLLCTLSKFADAQAAVAAAEGALTAVGGAATQPLLQIALLAVKTTMAVTLCEYEGALALSEASLPLVRSVHGERHPDYAVALHDRARVLHAKALFADARKGHEAALKILEDTLPPDHPLIATVSQSVGLVLSAGTGFAEAQERYCRVLQLRGTLFGSIHPAVADTLASLASLERIQGHMDEALALLEQSLSIRRSAYGTENHIEVAACMTQLGELLSMACKYTEAREAFVDALAIQRRVIGERKHPDVARSLLGIVGVQFAMGDYAAALPLVTEACDIRLAVLGMAHPDYANCLQHRARVVFVQGQYSEALALHEEALAILEACLGPDHPDVASAAQHVGVSCQFVVALPPAERFAKADAMLQKTLAIRRARFGENHPSVAETLGCLGSLRRTQGNLAEARALLERSLALRRKTQRVHMDVARTLLSLGNLLCQLAKHSEAKICYDEALEIADQLVGGADHPDVARILTGLAATKEAAGQLQGAQVMLERALRIQQNTLGQQHRETSSTYHNLALVLRTQGRNAEAQKLCEQALQQLEAKLGPEHPDVARALNTLAELHRNEHRYEKAAELYARSLAIFEKSMGPKDIQFAEALNNLANVYSDWKKHNEAIPLYARAVDVQKSILGASHRNVAITLRNLGINHQELGQAAEALKAYQESFAILKTLLGAKNGEVKSLKRVIDYLKGEQHVVQDALVSAVHKLKNLKIVPKLNILKRKTPQKVKLLSEEAAVAAPEDDEFDEEKE